MNNITIEDIVVAREALDNAVVIDENRIIRIGQEDYEILNKITY